MELNWTACRCLQRGGRSRKLDAILENLSHPLYDALSKTNPPSTHHKAPQPVLCSSIHNWVTSKMLDKVLKSWVKIQATVCCKHNASSGTPSKVLWNVVVEPSWYYTLFRSAELWYVVQREQEWSKIKEATMTQFFQQCNNLVNSFLHWSTVTLWLLVYFSGKSPCSPPVSHDLNSQVHRLKCVC